MPGLSFERVLVPEYPLFREPQYLLALTNTLVRVSRERRLDILHAHYAVPHATAAFLAHQILSATPGLAAPRTVTTLHGTDITLVGSDPSYAGVVGFSIERSHGVTAVSKSLRQETIQSLGITREIRVIPNFLDCGAYRRLPDATIRHPWRPRAPGEPIVMHVSNFRPVKRIDCVIEVFRRIQQQVPARLILVGDGPDRGAAERRTADLGLSGRVDFVGEQMDLVPWLSSANLLLLPSSQESFGLAALEAMACGVAVIASRLGGLPEIIEDGVTGFLRAKDDVDGMAAQGVEVLRDQALASRVGEAAAASVRRSTAPKRWCLSTRRTTAKFSTRLLSWPRRRRQHGLTKVADCAREDAHVPRPGADDQRAFDPDHEIFRALPGHPARQTGLDAERLNRLDPRAERPPERPPEAARVDAGAQALEQTRLPAALIEAVDHLKHAVKFPCGRVARAHRLKQGLLELHLEVGENLERNLLLAVRKVMIQARLAQTRRVGDVGQRRAVESLLTEQVHKQAEHVRLREQRRGHRLRSSHHFRGDGLNGDESSNSQRKAAGRSNCTHSRTVRSQ